MATSTESWLYRIATNTAIDEMRRRRNVTHHERRPADIANRADARPGPEAQVMAATLDERIAARDAARCARTTASA